MVLKPNSSQIMRVHQAQRSPIPATNKIEDFQFIWNFCESILPFVRDERACLGAQHLKHLIKTSCRRSPQSLSAVL